MFLCIKFIFSILTIDKGGYVPFTSVFILAFVGGFFLIKVVSFVSCAVRQQGRAVSTWASPLAV